MAASRVLAMRRLSSRYKYFFYIGATILLIQCLLAYYFLAVLNYSTKRSAVIDNNTIARRLGHNDPRNFTMVIFNGLKNIELVDSHIFVFSLYEIYHLVFSNHNA